MRLSVGCFSRTYRAEGERRIPLIHSSGLPLNTNGRSVRKGCPAPDLERASAEALTFVTEALTDWEDQRPRAAALARLIADRTTGLEIIRAIVAGECDRSDSGSRAGSAPPRPTLPPPTSWPGWFTGCSSSAIRDGRRRFTRPRMDRTTNSEYEPIHRLFSRQ